MNILVAPEAYDVIILCGQTSPGVCKVSGATDTRKWDEKKGTGISGATIVYGGDALGKFTVTFQFWDAAQLDEWDVFRALFSSKPMSKSPKALDIYHPFLDDLGIHAVVVEEIGQMEISDTGLVTVPVKFTQYRAPKKASGKPKGSDTTKNAGTPKPEDEWDKKIRDLTDQAGKLNQ